MHTAYEKDVIAWANEQAQLLRSRKLTELDIENIAEEIEDVGKSEQRELASRMSILLMHLLKWQYQSERRGNSWKNTIAAQRDSLKRKIKRVPSLKSSLSDEDWWADAWADAVASASKETGLESWPRFCPWPLDQIMNDEFFPD